MPWINERLRKYSMPALLGWLVLAQSVRWAEPWAAAISWALFGGLLAGWVVGRGRAALWAAWRSPLLPVLGAAVVSALAAGGWWSRVADWALYAAMLAFFLDRRPDLDRHLVTVGGWVIGVSLFEWLALLLDGGGRVHLLGNANVIAAMLVLVLPAGVERLRGLRRWAWLGLGLLALLATGSRAGALGVVLYGLAFYRRRLPRWLPVVGAVGILGVLMLARIGGTLQRVDLYRQAWAAFVRAPVAGVGAGQYRGVIARAPVMVGSNLCKPIMVHVHAHNLAMSMLAELGMVGLAGWALAGLRVCRWAWDGDRLARLVAMLPFYLVDDMTMWWFVSLGVFYLVSRARRDT